MLGLVACAPNSYRMPDMVQPVTGPIPCSNNTPYSDIYTIEGGPTIGVSGVTEIVLHSSALPKDRRSSQTVNTEIKTGVPVDKPDRLCLCQEDGDVILYFRDDNGSGRLNVSEQYPSLLKPGFSEE